MLKGISFFHATYIKFKFIINYFCFWSGTYESTLMHERLIRCKKTSVASETDASGFYFVSLYFAWKQFIIKNILIGQWIQINLLLGRNCQPFLAVSNNIMERLGGHEHWSTLVPKAENRAPTDSKQDPAASYNYKFLKFTG